ncbi:MAG: hypothetical protein DMF04_02840 [Verrucomicrobia bacterium]|nr:MAG: hypothetical protein DMF04_02840 [Verrucomicrobiota bacterium]
MLLEFRKIGWIALMLFLAKQGFALETMLADQRARGGDKVDLRFPISKYYQEYAAQGGNPLPTTGRLLMMFPPGFDPARSWPMLIISSTTDLHHTSAGDAPWYRAAAMAEGWVVLATDATIRPREDSTAWRVAILAAGLELIHHDWPQSKNWPVVFAGMSGGAKRSGWMGAMLGRTSTLDIRGFFLAGINDDRLSAALQAYPPSPEFFRVPVWISSGNNDPIAKPHDEEAVRDSLIHTGFRNVKLSHFLGGHELDRADLRRALQWFRQIGNF